MLKKRLPSKTSNYADLIESGMYYVDKTAFIQTLESISDKYLFFLRPRRFGKSLTISMLEHYYGVQYKEKFDALFGEYLIGSSGKGNKYRNSYYIFRLDFSGINTAVTGEIQEKFDFEVKRAILSFNTDYGVFTDHEMDIISSLSGSPEILKIFIEYFRKNVPGANIYLLIDEYDHFTNELFSFNTEHFKEIVTGNGWVRKFYEVIKMFMGQGVIDRFFATGVTPVTLDSMTSGFNVAKNITLSREFHTLTGFTEEEVISLINGTVYEEGAFIVDDVMNDLRLWYNGSRFSPDAEEKLYNPQMVINFLSEFSSRYENPREMADINVTSDYKKIANILGLLSAEDSGYIITEVLNNETITERLTFQFNFELPYGKQQAVSLLFYNGLLTIDSVKFNSYRFVIPNYVIKTMYWEYFRYLNETQSNIRYDNQKIDDAVIEMSETGSVDKLVQYVQSVMKQLSNRDIENFTEKSLKMIFMTLLTGTPAYYVKSETELQSGYADLVLRRTKINPGKHDFLIELKYIKQKELHKLDEFRESGLNQLKSYRAAFAVEEQKDLKAYLVIFFNRYDFELTEL